MDLQRTAGVALLILLAQGAFAQTPVAVRVGLSSAWPGLDTIYTTSHTPLSDFPGDGTITQSLPLDADGGLGFEAALEVGLSAAWGVQLLVDHAETDVTGEAGSYHTEMTYVSRPPPDYAPRLVTIDDTATWPPAAGRARTLALAANVSWTHAAGRVRLGVSAGPALLRTSGEVESVGLSAYRLGGHSVLFGDVAEAAVEYGPDTALGFDAGAFCEVDLGTRASLRVDARWFGAGEREVEVTPVRVLNADRLFIAPTDPASVARALAPAPLTVDPSFGRLAVTLGWRF